MGKHRVVITPRCYTCQFGLRTPGFNFDILHTSYFDPSSPVSIKDILDKYEYMPKSGMKSIMRHIKDHVEPKRIEAIETRVKQALTAADNGDIIPGKRFVYHEEALDKTIEEYYRLLNDGKVKVTADIGLKAIKIKSDIEKARQDRTMGAFKAFTGMSHGEIPKQIGKSAD